MQFLAILAIAFAATGVSACKDDNIFCAPGMGPCADPAANCAKRSVDTTFGGFANVARTVNELNKPAEAKIDAE
ncbi:hypothetical protein DPSP01_012501 [Paraphaeosphaeria sporulosa]|uniref:Uncharacterized protein n=1 Tax=Paraphaeosphaeria sporulosa TaxID=1460663 RepID=A0A177C063_9PLEO|nr:uncharacterized protein CC84DRAFT_1169062 [Paraphaeosphaeria sporulosa]OAG00242.1 hypothetical protein CC84DRAFT_1169062 [Paraphaeosphaeria sporulosa]